MPISPAPVTNRSQSSSKTVFGRNLHHHVFSSTRPSPHMGQAEKVEVGAIRFRMPRKLRLSRAKVDEACLVGMECKSKPFKTLAQYCQDPLGIDDVVKCHYGVVGIPYKGASPAEPWSHLTLKPIIQHMVQKNVREAG